MTCKSKLILALHLAFKSFSIIESSLKFGYLGLFIMCWFFFLEKLVLVWNKYNKYMYGKKNKSNMYQLS